MRSRSGKDWDGPGPETGNTEMFWSNWNRRISKRAWGACGDQCAQVTWQVSPCRAMTPIKPAVHRML